MGPPPPHRSTDDWRPPRRRSHLGWALLWSLLLNHTLLLPGAYLLLFADPGELPLDPSREIELELTPVTTPARPKPRPSLAMSPPRQRTPRDARTPKLPTLEPPRPTPPRPKPPEPKPPEPSKPRPPLAVPRMKMVETNTPETERPPDRARYLSDKNRRVERETRARQTNLRRDDPRPRPPPSRAEQRRLHPGEKRPKLSQTERRPTPDPRTRPKTERAQRLLKMRQARPARRALTERPHLAEQAPDGVLQPARRARPGQRVRPKRLDLGLDHRAYDRIAGQRAVRERRQARLSISKPKGRRHQRKWHRIRAALENFVPEVQPGNQTALGTRAHPFAVFIAHMHRRIHSLWGYGFLVDLDSKPDAHPMNNMRLWTMVEVVVAPSGAVAKATIVKSSGYLPYDVAALDTVFSASPYPRPPRAIRSADGRAYLHWRFHRDHRQCGTFGVDPYVLTKPPEGPIDGDRAEVGRARVARLNRPQAPSARPPVGWRAGPRPPHARRARPRRSPPAGAARAARSAALGRVSSDDPRARSAARRFLDGFTRGSAARMAAACALPFRSRGRKVASSRKDLQRMLGDLLREARSRKIGPLGLMTPMEARRALGHLPRGVSWGEQKLVGRVDLGGIPLTLVLERSSRGTWWVRGIDR